MDFGVVGEFPVADFWVVERGFGGGGDALSGGGGGGREGALLFGELLGALGELFALRVVAGGHAVGVLEDVFNVVFELVLEGKVGFCEGDLGEVAGFSAAAFLGGRLGGCGLRPGQSGNGKAVCISAW